MMPLGLHFPVKYLIFGFPWQALSYSSCSSLMTMALLEMNHLKWMLLLEGLKGFPLTPLSYRRVMFL